MHTGFTQRLYLYQASTISVDPDQNHTELRIKEHTTMTYKFNSKRRSSPRPFGSILRIFTANRNILVVVLSMLLLVPNAPHAQELFAKEHTDYSPAFVGKYLNPQVFAQLTVQNDETGDYVQIDDMRFRANEMRTFGYKGLTWYEGKFVYEFAPSADYSNYRSMFEDACQEVASHASLECVERSVATDRHRNNYVLVHNDLNENSSYVGMIGGKQIMKISAWYNKGVIMHEILHALGWVHEHSRNDRDEFVEVHWENIIPDKKRNFYIDSNARLGFAYDFASIMHYPTGAFVDTSSGISGKTLEPRPNFGNMEPLMGSSRLSKTDIAELVHHYGKPGSEWCGYDPRTPPMLCSCTIRGWCCDGDHFCCSPSERDTGKIERRNRIAC